MVCCPAEPLRRAGQSAFRWLTGHSGRIFPDLTPRVGRDGRPSSGRLTSDHVWFHEVDLSNLGFRFDCRLSGRMGVSIRLQTACGNIEIHVNSVLLSGDARSVINHLV